MHTLYKNYKKIPIPNNGQYEKLIKNYKKITLKNKKNAFIGNNA